jgi:hypothetical protein
MSLQIGAALRNGLDDLASGRGLLFVAVFVVVSLLNAVFTQSASVVFSETVLSSVPSDQQAQAPAQQAAEASPFALDIPLGVAVLGILALFLLTEVLRIVAIRSFASADPDPLPADATRNLGSVAVTAIVAGIVVAVTVVLGLVLFVIPGLLLVVLFTFVRQEIALNDSGVRAALKNSVSLVSDNAVPTAALVLLLFVLGIAVSTPLQFAPVALPPLLTTVVSTVLGQIVAVYGIAVFTDAYQQITDAGTQPVDTDAEPVSTEF